jgi:hypothetical protein
MCPCYEWTLSLSPCSQVLVNGRVLSQTKITALAHIPSHEASITFSSALEYSISFSSLVLWLKFCAHLSSPSRTPRRNFSLHPATFDHANNIWPKVLIRKFFVALKLGRCGRGLQWLRTGPSGALSCDRGVPLNGSEQALVVHSRVIVVFH